MKKEHRRIWFCIELKRHKVTLKPQRSFSVRKSFVVPIIVHYGIYHAVSAIHLEVFLRNLLLNEKNELHNRNLHISGLLNEEKVDIGDSKVDIENEKVDVQDKKVDIESVLSGKGSDFSVKTTIHIHRLFERFGFDEVFGRSAVMELLELKGSGASKLLSNLVKADIIEPVSGHGKGRYKFKK